MIQPVDSNMNKATYNAVKLNIKRPEVNVNGNDNLPNNGNFNAVNIDIDKPSVNTEPKKIYDYPIATTPITYDMANLEQIKMPQGFNLAYHTTNVILPKIENEVEVESQDAKETNTNNNIVPETQAEPLIEEAEVVMVDIPAPNYTTVEAEKELEAQDRTKNDTNIGFKGVEKKVPEIIPGEEIKPDVDIPLVISNLNSTDFDTQATQMEEIVRISLDNNENALPYIVRDVFVPLINITKKDTSNLQTPSPEQIDARKKIITNFLVIENAKQNNVTATPPFEISTNEFELANTLSKKEEAERNKEYALYTISTLAKIYTDEVEKQTGNIVPFTDLPGSSAIVDALRYNPNAGVKIAAIDSLQHMSRPEYKDELNALYKIAATDTNPQVAITAQRATNQ